ncbi:hypothetical protein GCM10010170_080860 [Dactylosporangium salmoneum]|uniref:DUF3592 domain-containing protein n=1 Tax=Dactylosporangium salmoneum TaxID=53361 RepID=A0ABP5UCK4_9ACTN
MRWAAVRCVGGAVAGMLVTVGWLFVSGGRHPVQSGVAGLVVGSFATAFYRRGADVDRPRGVWAIWIGHLLAIVSVVIWVPAFYERSQGAVVHASVTAVGTHFTRVAPHTRYDIQLFDDAHGRYLSRWLDGTRHEPWRVGDRVDVYADPDGTLQPLLLEDAETDEWAVVLSVAALALTAAAARPWARSIRVLPPGEPDVFQRLRQYFNGPSQDQHSTGRPSETPPGTSG